MYLQFYAKFKYENNSQRLIVKRTHNKKLKFFKLYAKLIEDLLTIQKTLNSIYQKYLQLLRRGVVNFYTCELNHQQYNRFFASLLNSYSKQNFHIAKIFIFILKNFLLVF